MPDSLDRRSFLAGALAATQTPESRLRPNILHIMTDQQQWATIAGRSGCRTPNIDRLAGQGMLFERSYTPSAVCCPARAMMLSGAYHWHNGVYNQVHSPPSVHRDLNPDVVLYSQRLRDAGYRLGYIGKWHCQLTCARRSISASTKSAGVAGCDPDMLEGRSTTIPTASARVSEPLRTTQQRMMRWPGSEPFAMWGYREGPGGIHARIPHRRDAPSRMMKRFAQGQRSPWHLEVHFVEPHDPYMPLKKYLDRYDPRDIPVPKSFADTFAGKPGLHRRESETWGRVTEDDVRQSRAHYYAYTEQVDAQIGRVLKALDETGQADRTLVAFTTDHGDMVGAHRMWIKGWLPYEECYRVPMIVRWPGHVQPGTKTSKLVQTHDLGHTYVAAAGARALPFPDGARFSRSLTTPPAPIGATRSSAPTTAASTSIRSESPSPDRFKYVFNGFDYDEMYDLERDPDEMHNVVAAADYRRFTGDMQARMYELMARFHDPYGDSPVKCAAIATAPRAISRAASASEAPSEAK